MNFPGFESDVVLRNMDVYMSLEGDAELSFDEGVEGQIGVSSRGSLLDVDVFSGNFRKDDDDDGSLKISGMMQSLSLPSELMSSALTYKKAYCSSLFVGNCWAAERTLPRINMPIRMRSQRPQKTKLSCLTW